MYKKYVDEINTYIVRDSDGANIPMAIGNRDYDALLIWMKTEGKTIDDLEIANPPQPPQPEPDEKEIKYNSKTKTFVFKSNGKWEDVEEATLKVKLKL